jgi:hypothetical protein
LVVLTSRLFIPVLVHRFQPFGSNVTDRGRLTDYDSWEESRVSVALASCISIMTRSNTRLMLLSLEISLVVLSPTSSAFSPRTGYFKALLVTSRAFATCKSSSWFLTLQNLTLFYVNRTLPHSSGHSTLTVRASTTILLLNSIKRLTLNRKWNSSAILATAGILNFECQEYFLDLMGFLIIETPLCVPLLKTSLIWS